jgi:hypothetical protein
LQNRDARDIIIDCKICNKKQSLSYLQFHDILAQNFKTIITTKEFDVVSFLFHQYLALDREPLRAGGMEAGLLPTALLDRLFEPPECPLSAHVKVTKFHNPLEG